MGVSLNGGTPKTPQNDHLEFLVGKPMVVGYHILGNPLMSGDASAKNCTGDFL